MLVINNAIKFCQNKFLKKIGYDLKFSEHIVNSCSKFHHCLNPKHSLQYNWKGNRRNNSCR